MYYRIMVIFVRRDVYCRIFHLCVLIILSIWMLGEGTAALSSVDKVAHNECVLVYYILARLFQTCHMGLLKLAQKIYNPIIFQEAHLT